MMAGAPRAALHRHSYIRTSPLLSDVLHLLFRAVGRPDPASGGHAHSPQADLGVATISTRGEVTRVERSIGRVRTRDQARRVATVAGHDSHLAGPSRSWRDDAIRRPCAPAVVGIFAL